MNPTVNVLGPYTGSLVLAKKNWGCVVLCNHTLQYHMLSQFLMLHGVKHYHVHLIQNYQTSSSYIIKCFSQTNEIFLFILSLFDCFPHSLVYKITDSSYQIVCFRLYSYYTICFACHQYIHTLLDQFYKNPKFSTPFFFLEEPMYAGSYYCIKSQ